MVLIGGAFDEIQWKAKNKREHKTHTFPTGTLLFEFLNFFPPLF